jgi:hypothetical protein
MFKRFPATRWLALTSLGAAAIVLAVLATPRFSSAQQSGDAVYLRGSQQVQQDRVQLINEEFRERQHERAEALERARRAAHGKRSRGVKAVRAPGDDDRYVGASAAMKMAKEFGLNRTFVAPTNTKANDKTGDAANAGQAEQEIAVLGQNGLCAWNDGQGFVVPPDVQGFGWTVNGGATWTDGGVPLKGGTITTWTSDPSVAVNEKTGDFYYCGLTANSGVNNNGLGVVRGHFAGGTYIQDAATVVAAGPSSSQSFDKQWLAADSSNGNLYATWTLFIPGGNNIYFARSTDNGATWSVPVIVSAPWEVGRVQGSRPQVGPNGEVYITYSAIGTVDADSIKVVKSSNGGLTFGPSVVGMVEYTNYFTGAPGFNRPRAVTFPSIAVDRSFGPNRGRVYLTIQDCVNFYGDPLFINSGISEVEVNNGFANANAFTVGQTLRGSLSSTSDQDWFSFPATVGTTYLFYVDSLRTTSFRYTMRLYCPNDTLALSRLAFSGAQATNSALNSHSLIVWTCPATNTYYLRMIPVTVGTGTNGYRILSGTHTPVGSDVARDARDVVESSSADGVTGWTPRAIVNDEAALYDDWLPEVQVPCDGNPYIYWFDFRDAAASCFGGTNIYLTRSTNAGSTWATSQVATTAPTPNWTQVASNIAPNQGDYNGLYGGDALALAFADGRLGDADVFTAKLDIHPAILCPNDSTVLANTTYNTTFYVTNLNQMFANNEFVNVTADRNWPGLPASAGLGSVPSLGQAGYNFSLAIPDTAANGDIHICFTATCAGGTCAQTCCVTLHVLNPATATLASLMDASADVNGVHLMWEVQGLANVNLYRGVSGSWSQIATLTPDGSRRVSYNDASVIGGRTYGYRLGFPSPSGEQFAGEIYVDVPVTAEFALRGARPNPSVGSLAFAFSLADDSPATLELVDLVGRRVFTRQVGTLGAGFHIVPMSRANLPIGIYAVRLTQHGRTLSSKVTVIR